jgi:hypothetical protein
MIYLLGPLGDERKNSASPRRFFGNRDAINSFMWLSRKGAKMAKECLPIGTKKKS